MERRATPGKHARPIKPPQSDRSHDRKPPQGDRNYDKRKIRSPAHTSDDRVSTEAEDGEEDVGANRRCRQWKTIGGQQYNPQGRWTDLRGRGNLCSHTRKIHRVERANRISSQTDLSDGHTDNSSKLGGASGEVGGTAWNVGRHLVSTLAP